MSHRERAKAEEAKARLGFALEQIEKGQYWNALSWVNAAEKSLQEAFDAVLKEKS